MILAMSISVGLAACGKAEEKKVATQIAATVSGEEISVHQINQVLNNANTNGATADRVQAMSREVLEKLIDQQLAIEQATEKKLNRSPDVMAQLEAARREILARAYVQQLIGAVPKPTEDEVKKYYAEHPQLFAERRIFNVQELIVPAAPGLAEQLSGLVNSGKPVEEIIAWLKAHDTKFSGGNATRAAEQLPMDLLDRLHKLKDGQSLMAQTPQAITLIHLASSKTAPVAEAAAAPSIAQYLGTQRSNEAIATNMKALRQKAKIEYQGDFAKPIAKTDAKTDTKAEPSTGAATAPAAAASVPVDQAKDNLEKGVAGLK